MKRQRGRGITLLLVAAFLAVFSSLAVGCSCDELFGFFSEPAAEVQTPQQAMVGGLTFNYPGNWKLTNSSEMADGITIDTAELESPGTSYMMVQVFNQPLPLDTELDSLINQGLIEMKAAVNDMSAGLMGANGADLIQPFQRNMLGAPRAARRAVVQYSVLNEPLPYRLEVVGAVIGDRSVLVMYGIAEEDWAAVAPGYDQVVDTLVVAQAATTNVTPQFPGYPAAGQPAQPGVVVPQPSMMPNPANPAPLPQPVPGYPAPVPQPAPAYPAPVPQPGQ